MGTPRLSGHDGANGSLWGASWSNWSDRTHWSRIARYSKSDMTYGVYGSRSHRSNGIGLHRSNGVGLLNWIYW